MNPTPGGFSFGQPAGSNFSFGQQAAGTQQTGGMQFNQPPPSTTTAVVNPMLSGGFNFSNPKPNQSAFPSTITSPAPAAGGFSFTSPTINVTPAGGINFGGPPPYSQAGGTNTVGGFTATTNSSGFGFGQTTSTTTTAIPGLSGSFNFGKPATPFGQVSQTPTAVVSAQPSTGFSFNQPPTTNVNAGGFPFGQTAPSATLSGGFNVGTTNATVGFGMGTNPTTTAMTGGFSFGSSANTATGAFNLGGGPTTQVSSGGFGLGAPAASTPTQPFGAAASTPTPPFGAAASTPTPPFGAAASTPTPPFGTAAAKSVVPGVTNFSSTFSPSVTSSFGLSGTATPAPTGGFSIGAAPATAPALNLTMGAAQTVSTAGGFAMGGGASTGGFSFGIGGTSGPSTIGANSSASGLAPASTTALGFNLGGVAPTPFGIASTSTSLAGGFGINTSTASSTVGLSTVPAGGINFSAPAVSTATGFNKPAAVTMPGLGFSMTHPTSAGFNLGTAPAATPASGFTVGQPLVSTASFSVPGARIGLPASTGTTVASTGYSSQVSTSVSTPFTLGQALPSSGTGLTFPTGVGLNLGSSTVPISATTSSVGLGGTTTSGTGLGGAQAPATDAEKDSLKTDSKSIREMPLPTDIFASIAVFQTYKDSEKKASEENARQSATPFHKLGEDAKKMKQHIVKLSNQHSHLHSGAAKLKSFVVQDALNVEMARRTQDTPMNLQGENKSPEEFFLKMVRSFEARMASCRNKIDEVEKGCTFKEGMPEATPEDIMVVLKREHRAVKMMAAQVYTIHNKLIDVYQKLDSNVQPKPELLFRTASPEKVDLMSIINKDSSVLRPCIGDISSGLLDFQHGQQKVKALSLGVAPPNQALGQGGSPFLNPSVMQSPSTLNVGQNGNNSSFNFGKRPYGSTTNSFSSPFSPANQTSGNMFGGNSNNSSFGMFGK